MVLAVMTALNNCTLNPDAPNRSEDQKRLCRFRWQAGRNGFEH